MKIRILLYITPKKFGFKYLVNHLISLRTWSKWSHIEILVPDDGVDAGGTIQDFWDNGTCYTSTMRDDDNGTVKRPASKVLTHPERWDYIEIEVDVANWHNLEAYMLREVNGNEGYSKWDILKFLSPIHFPDNKRNICSEFVNDALCVGQIIKGYGIVSPNAVAKKLIKQGYHVEGLTQ